MLASQAHLEIGRSLNLTSLLSIACCWFAVAARQLPNDFSRTASLSPGSIAEYGIPATRELRSPCIQGPVQSSCTQALLQLENGLHQPAQLHIYCKQLLQDQLVEGRRVGSSALQPLRKARHSCKKQLLVGLQYGC